MSDHALPAADRDRIWSSLADEVFDLVVVGAGITGCGIARDAAGRGLKVVLIDSGDIGGGTSSRSSRLIHGGLRYLETFEFPLVFEALRERRRLLELAPHLVRPLAFLFPVYRGDDTGVLKLGAGMWLYDILSMFRSPQRHRMLSRAGVEAEEPALKKQDLAGGAVYYDAQVDDARLTLGVARSAGSMGAAVVTRARVTAIVPGRQEVGTVSVRDDRSGAEVEVQARVILTAAGPWSDEVRALADPSVQRRLRPTKGVHIVVERERIDNHNAIIFRSPVDGRVMFVLPWREYAYVGTTDTEFHGDPREVDADESDIRYLLDSANGIFPEAHLRSEDVLSTWAGVRPLLAPSDGSLSESQTSREHEIWRDPSGLLNIAGGKLTTYRSMAAEAVDVAAEILRNEFDVVSGKCYTEFLPLPGATEDEEGELARLADRLDAMGLPDDVLRPMWRRYGTEMSDVLDLIGSEKSLAERIVPDRPYLKGEVIWAVREEMAIRLEDVMRRRLQLFYDEDDGGLDVADRVAGWMAGEAGLDWTEDQRKAEVEGYRASVAASRPNRPLS